MFKLINLNNVTIFCEYFTTKQHEFFTELYQLKGKYRNTIGNYFWYNVDFFFIEKSTGVNFQIENKVWKIISCNLNLGLLWGIVKYFS